MGFVNYLTRKLKEHSTTSTLEFPKLVPYLPKDADGFFTEGIPLDEMKPG